MRALKAVRQHHESYSLKSGVFHFYRGEHGPAADFLTRALTGEEEISTADRRAALYYLVQTRIGAATEFEQRGELERAVEQYECALEVMPQYADVQFRLGMTLRQLDRLDQAIRHFERSVESSPSFAEGYVQLGFALLKSQRLDEAQQAFDRAAAAKSANLSKRIDKAREVLETGDVEEATTLYRDAFRDNVAEFERVFGEGLRLLRLEKWEEATEPLTHAADLRPRFADVHNYLGVALAEAEQPDLAMDSFERSTSVNPDYLVAWLNLAYTAFESGEFERARHALSEIDGREPDNPPARHLAEKLLHAAGTSRK